MRSRAGLIAILLLAATPTPGWAQDTGDDIDANVFPAPAVSPPTPAGQTTDTVAGRAGERRTREQVDGVQPMGRINNRIQNRVQARMRNRIDRYYDPAANAASPFEVAGEATRRAGQRRPR